MKNLRKYVIGASVLAGLTVMTLETVNANQNKVVTLPALSETITTQNISKDELGSLIKKEEKQDIILKSSSEERKQALENQKRKEEEKRLAEEKAKKEEEERQKQEAERKRLEEEKASSVASGSDTPQFGSNGLLIERYSPRAQQVINLLMAIPGHRNGAAYHKSTGLDSLIDQLSTEEAVYVIHRIEGAGFGQTGDGYAGYDTPISHQTFVRNQVNKRFGGSVKALLKRWGTYSYGGY